MKKQIKLDKAREKLYKKASLHIYVSYFIQIIIFFFGLILIFTSIAKNNLFHPSTSIWISFAMTLTLITLTIILKKGADNNYELAEEIRKFELIDENFSTSIEEIEKSYIIAKLPKHINKLVQVSEIPSQEENFLGKAKIPFETSCLSLISSVQQNCFYTSILMKKYSFYLWLGVCILAILIVLSVIFAFIFYEMISVENIKQFILLVINLAIGLNFYDHYSSFKKRSIALEKIDIELDNMYNDFSQEKALATFSEYNYVLANALPVPDIIYRYNKDNLEKAWKCRTERNIKKILFNRTFEAFVIRLEEENIKYLLTGSYRFIFPNNFSIEPNDIDILTDEDGFNLIKDIFKDYTVEKFEYKEHANLKSNYGKLVIDGVEFDIMAKVENKINGNWEQVPNFDKIEYIKLKDKSIPVMPMTTELDIAKKLNDTKKIEIIKSILSLKKLNYA